MDRYSVYTQINSGNMQLAETYYQADAEAVLANHPQGTIVFRGVVLVEKKLRRDQ